MGVAVIGQLQHQRPGDDEARERAFLDVANDSHFHSMWIGRGGYGSCRFAERVLPHVESLAVFDRE